MNERDLVLALKNGSEAAFEELYNRYWHKVYHFASLYIMDKEEAKDVVQEVFVKLWNSKEFLRENENFKGFLFIVTRNHVFNKSKTNYFNYDFYQLTIDNALEHSYHIENELEAKELEIHIDRLIDEMPQKRQLVFKLSRKEYRSYKEIAAMLHISEKTVERHINEALKYIKSNLEMLLVFILIDFL